MHPREEKKDDKKSDSYAVILAKTDSRKPLHEVKQQKPKTKLKEGSKDALENSKTAATIALPMVTVGGFALMFSKEHGIAADLFRIMGFFMAVSGPIIDAIKLPIGLVVSTEEAARGGILALGSAIREGNPEKQQINKVSQSFIQRMQETANLLVELKLEKREELVAKIQAKNFEELMGMTLLYTAYHSRYHKDGILLANEKVFTLEHCPEKYRPLLKSVNALKQSIRTGLRIDDSQSAPDAAKSLDDAKVIAPWLEYIKRGASLEGSAHGLDDHAPKIVNQVIELIRELKQVAMVQLPEKTEKAMHKLGKR